MASTLTTSKVAAGIQPRTPHSGVVAVKGVYALAAALVVDDVIQMVKIPKGAMILDMVLSAEDLDSGGSPAIVLDVGDGGDTDRFIDGSTIGQAGGVIRLGSGVAAAVADGTNGYVYTADDTIDVYVQVAPATGATTGNITLTVIYTMED